MNQSNPELSVIVPCHNAAPWLDRCLESLLNQNLAEIEIICVDDGSTDESSQILADCAKRDQRLKVIRKDAGGVSSARNAGLRKVTSPFVTFVDADDWVRPAIYETALSIMRADEEIDLVTWRYDRVAQKKDGTLVRLKGGCGAPGHLRGKQSLNENSGVFQDAMVWNKIFKTELINSGRIEFPEGRLHEDRAFFWQYLARARHAFYLDEVFNLYLERPQSLTSLYEREPQRRLELIEVMDWVLAGFEREGSLDELNRQRASEVLVSGRYLIGLPWSCHRQYLNQARDLALKYDLPDCGCGYIKKLKMGEANPAGLSFWTRRMLVKKKDISRSRFYLFGLPVLSLPRRAEKVETQATASPTTAGSLKTENR